MCQIQTQKHAYRKTVELQKQLVSNFKFYGEGSLEFAVLKESMYTPL